MSTATGRTREFNHYCGFVLTLFLLFGVVACGQSSSNNPTEKIDRRGAVERHNPSVTRLDPTSPFTLGNGQFAFTADVTGLQSYPDIYYEQGIPLETKARWAWHSRPNPRNFRLQDTSEIYQAYGHETKFPTEMDSESAQWLRQNPHDLPLARIGFSQNGTAFSELPKNINQTLDMWRGELLSEFSIEGKMVNVKTLVDNDNDRIAVSVQSELLATQALAVDILFPRGYKLDKKNTPDLDFSNNNEHKSKIFYRHDEGIILQRNIDNAQHLVFVQWQTQADLIQVADHHFRLVSRSTDTELIFSVTFSQDLPKSKNLRFNDFERNVANYWENFWTRGAFVDFSGSTNSLANELERRIILSRYLMAVQERAAMPAQESGLTHSSWYGKYHSEMAWWHNAHWIFWGNSAETAKLLLWYKNQLPSARTLANERGLKGARWAKMVGPDNRESPGGNPLIIWNQPQVIHLAELLYQSKDQNNVLNEYADLVEESALALSSMLMWDEENKLYNLEPPIWIAQEIYDPRLSKNPTFELAYWKLGLQIAQTWRTRLGKPISTEWQHKIDNLAPLPIKDEKYVAIESVPDTFDNSDSRQDHPSMLAAFGMLNSSRVNKEYMRNTLNAVLENWNWQEKIWGWDYPMIAMTAARLGEPQTAVDILLSKNAHNNYLNNGHVPQAGAELRAYLPANGALLSAVAMMLAGWEGAPARAFPGFPEDGSWSIKAEGFKKFQ